MYLCVYVVCGIGILHVKLKVSIKCDLAICKLAIPGKYMP